VPVLYKIWQTHPINKIFKHHGQVFQSRKIYGTILPIQQIYAKFDIFIFSANFSKGKDAKLQGLKLVDDHASQLHHRLRAAPVEILQVYFFARFYS
jgi:hypothetical protein